MVNDGNYPASFYFSLSFKGEDSAFQEVSGISNELSVEDVASGGENRFKHRLPANSSSQNLVLKRGFVSIGSQLINWCTSTLDGALGNPIEMHDVSVRLLNADNLVVLIWTFYKAYPVKWVVSYANSQGNTLAIESVELAYTHFVRSDSSVSSG